MPLWHGADQLPRQPAIRLNPAQLLAARKIVGGCWVASTFAAVTPHRRSHRPRSYPEDQIGDPCCGDGGEEQATKELIPGHGSATGAPLLEAAPVSEKRVGLSRGPRPRGMGV
jgi:hypothetical protein